MGNIFNSLFGWLNTIQDFLNGIILLNTLFLFLFVVIIIWMFITNKRVKRAIRDPLKKYDSDIKKKQKELDREKTAIRAYVEKEVKKIMEAHGEIRAEAEEEIKAMKALRAKRKARRKKRTGLSAIRRVRTEPVEQKISVKKAEKAEPPEKVEQPAPEVRIEKEAPVEKEVQIEHTEAVPEKVKAEEAEVREEKPEMHEEKESKKDMTGKLHTEQFFILSAIGDEPDKTMQEDLLFKTYQIAFEDKTKEDFDHAVRKLQERGFVLLEKPSGYRIWVKITDKGLEHYQEMSGK